MSAHINTEVLFDYSASTDSEYANNIEQNIMGKYIEDVTVSITGDLILSFSGGFELTLTPKDIYRISFP